MLWIAVRSAVPWHATQQTWQQESITKKIKKAKGIKRQLFWPILRQVYDEQAAQRGKSITRNWTSEKCIRHPYIAKMLPSYQVGSLRAHLYTITSEYSKGRTVQRELLATWRLDCLDLLMVSGENAENQWPPWSTLEVLVDSPWLSLLDLFWCDLYIHWPVGLACRHDYSYSIISYSTNVWHQRHRHWCTWYWTDKPQERDIKQHVLYHHVFKQRCITRLLFAWVGIVCRQQKKALRTR